MNHGDNAYENVRTNTFRIRGYTFPIPWWCMPVFGFQLEVVPAWAGSSTVSDAAQDQIDLVRGSRNLEQTEANGRSTAFDFVSLLPRWKRCEAASSTRSLASCDGFHRLTTSQQNANFKYQKQGEPCVRAFHWQTPPHSRIGHRSIGFLSTALYPKHETPNCPLV